MLTNTLVPAAHACGNLLLEIRTQELHALDKPGEQRGAHFATQGDTESQALGIKIIQREMPQEIIIAEEAEHTGSIPSDCTVFDPLDGTTAYYGGFNDFGVTLCTLRNNKPVAGVIYLPAYNITLSASHGNGCQLNGQLLPSLTWNRPLDKTMIGTDIGPWIVHEVFNALSRHFTIRSLLSAVCGFHELLVGRTGAYYNLGVAKIWDVAAGALMLEELGGVISDPWGNALTWDAISMDWVAAATPELAAHVLTHTQTWKGRTP